MILMIMPYHDLMILTLTMTLMITTYHPVWRDPRPPCLDRPSPAIIFIITFHHHHHHHLSWYLYVCGEKLQISGMVHTLDWQRCAAKKRNNFPYYDVREIFPFLNLVLPRWQGHQSENYASDLDHFGFTFSFLGAVASPAPTPVSQ